MMDEFIIETRHLTKQYGTQKSVSDLNIHVKKGRVYGLLGRNGAGKTTTMKMLLGLTEPTSGEIELWGKPLRGNEKEVLPRPSVRRPVVGHIVDFHMLPFCPKAQIQGVFKHLVAQPAR